MMALYLLGLIVSLGGLGALDRRYKLALWREPKRTALTVVCAVTIFIVWDLAGISLGIFHAGSSPFMLPFHILPEFPLEEIFFLTLLCYTTLILYRGATKSC